MQQETLMTTLPNRWTTGLAALAAACALVACGGGNDSGSATTASNPAPIILPAGAVTESGAPASVGNVAIDGRNWINFRRSQIGMPLMTQNALVDRAAQAHSDYQRINDTITHDEIAGKSGFTGVDLLARLNQAGYSVVRPYAYGEVISATSSNSGFYMADELITAIYHRFVIFEPMFKEIGTGSGTTAKNYTYFTADFSASSGFGQGIGRGVVAAWPYNGQTSVTPNFFSDYEEPDPVPDRNEVGYPVSVHADITALLTVRGFTIRPRGGAELAVRLLEHNTDTKTPVSAAAIVPLAPLQAKTTYDVSFTGEVGFSGVADTLPVSKTWSFTTK
ncbi:MAG: hypothetical protein JWR40_2508 [Massilia sp.]|jgi:uncharacterized protein YkwD|nr:hypothetical protein [Massilia sp.]MDB5952677.1 hypothetical protein [Massilia sp.]